MVTWGTNPGMVVQVTDAVPEPQHRPGRARARLHGARAGHADRARSSSTACSSARARTRGSGICARPPRWSSGRKVADSVYAMVVPGSQQVKAQAERRGSTRSSARAGFDWRGGGLLDVPGDEPRHRRARASGSRRPRTATSRGARGAARDRIWSRRRWPRRPRSRATSSTSGSGRARAMRAIETITGRVSVLNRDDVDTDQIIPKQFLKRVERTGFGEFLFFDWAKEPGWDLPPEPDPRRRAQLRLRLEPRARAVGARGLRLPGDHRAELRRHLPLQLHEDRAAARSC